VKTEGEELAGAGRGVRLSPADAARRRQNAPVADQQAVL
jgi:hypothetical protein